MTEKRFTYENHKVKDNLTGEVHSSNMVSVNVLNELHEENRALKCILAVDSVDYITVNDKKIDIPPYYEFEERTNCKKHLREEYEEWW